MWFAGVGLTMPLFDGFLTKAKVGQAKAQFQKVKGQKTAPGDRPFPFRSIIFTRP